MPNNSETVNIFEQKFYMNCLMKFSFSKLQNSRALCKKKIKEFYFCYM